MDGNLEGSKTIHQGIALLRIPLALLVVYNHAPSKGNATLPFWLQHSFDLLCVTAVPCFVLMSFFLIAPAFLQGAPIGQTQLFKRLKRLLVPFIGWSIVGFLAYPKKISPVNIAFQILFGSVVNSPLYYLAIVIYSVALLSMLTWAKTTFRMIIMATVLLCCFALEHTELNYEVFSSLPESSRYTLGRFCELFPYAVAGIFLRRFFDMRQCFDAAYRPKLWYWAIIISALAAGAALWSKLPVSGFGYQGIGLALFTCSVFSAFLVQPNARMAKVVPKLLMSISSVSLGVFCSHYIVNRIIRSWFGSSAIYESLTSIPFIYGLLLFLCSVFLCLKIKNSFDGKLADFVS